MTNIITTRNISQPSLVCMLFLSGYNRRLMHKPAELCPQSLLHIWEHIISQDAIKLNCCVFPLFIHPECVLPVPQLWLLNLKSWIFIPEIFQNLLQGFNHSFRFKVSWPVGSLDLTWHAKQGVAVLEGLLQRWLALVSVGIFCLGEDLMLGTQLLQVGVNRWVLSAKASQEGGGFHRRPCCWLGSGGITRNVVQDTFTGGQGEGKRLSSLTQVLLSFFIPTHKNGYEGWPTSSKRKERLKCRAQLHKLREGFLTSDDEVGSPCLEDDPGIGLNPQPLSCFGEQPEDREAAVSSLDHWEQNKHKAFGRRQSWKGKRVYV